MERIEIKFTACSCLLAIDTIVVKMTLNDSGKNYSVDKVCEYSEEGNHYILPKRVLSAFNERAINRILSNEEIPNEEGVAVLDGQKYELIISKGNIHRIYHADDASIGTYPLLRYLASWCRKQRVKVDC